MEASQANWRRRDDFRDEQVISLNPHFRLTEWAIAYLYRKITAREAMEITGYFGSDDGLVVWLNGEKLISQDVPRGPAPDQDKAVLKLRAGENDLLLKIVNRTGGWGYYFSTRPGGGNPEENPTHRRRVELLWQRVRADFGGAEERLQMQTESDDGLWPLQWPGDEESLARRTHGALGAHLAAAKETLTGLELDLGRPAGERSRGVLDGLEKQAGVLAGGARATGRRRHRPRALPSRNAGTGSSRGPGTPRQHSPGHRRPRCLLRREVPPAPRASASAWRPSSRARRVSCRPAARTPAAKPPRHLPPRP